MMIWALMCPDVGMTSLLGTGVLNDDNKGLNVL